MTKSAMHITGRTPYTHGINVGVRVLGLSVLGENTRSNLIDLADKLEERVIRKLLKRKLALRSVTGVCLSQNCVSVTRDNTTSVQSRPEVVLDRLVAEIVTNSLLHLGEPVQNLLVGQSVKGTGKTVKTGCQREHGRAKSRSNQMGSMGRDVTTFL
jgi:hypothetical protein